MLLPKGLDVIQPYADWLEETLESEWSTNNFHGSMLGKCPKANLLTILEADKKVKTDEEILSMHQTFRLGHVIEDDIKKAWARKGYLFSSNSPLTNSRYPGWTMTLDAALRFLEHPELGLVVAEVKSIHPNAFNYTDNLPYEHNMLQALSYGFALRDMGFPCDWIFVIYISRGGGKKPMVYWHELNDVAQMKLDAAVKETEDAWQVYEDCGELPPCLPRTEKFKLDKKKQLWELYLEPSWWCNGRCDYPGVSCDPCMSTNKVLDISKGVVKVRKEYEDYQVVDTKTLKEIVNKTKEVIESGKQQN